MRVVFGRRIKMLENTKIAMIGLGYVGLPLAVEFGKNMRLLVLILVNHE